MLYSLYCQFRSRNANPEVLKLQIKVSNEYAPDLSQAALGQVHNVLHAQNVTTIKTVRVSEFPEPYAFTSYLSETSQTEEHVKQSI